MTLPLRMILACALMFAACDHAATMMTQPSGSSSNPGLASPQFTVRVDSHGSAVAIAGVSEVTFDARATPGDKLRYEVQFGDGASAATPVATHVYDTPGTFQAAVAVIDAAGRRSSTSSTVVVKAVKGTWFYSDYNEASRRAEVHRITITEQNGLTVRGVHAAMQEPDRPINGTLSAERSMHLAVSDQSLQFDGALPGDIFSDVSLTATGGRINAQTLPFRFVSSEPSGVAPIARLSVRADPQVRLLFGYAVMGLTPFGFDASQSQGDGLSYVLEFGDGEYTREPSTRHAAMTPGDLIARVVVTDRFGRFDVATQNFGHIILLHDEGYHVGWFHSFTNPATGLFEYRELHFLTHQGRSVTGIYRHPTGAGSPFVGTFDGAGGIELTLLGGGITFRGKLVQSLAYYAYTDMQLTLYGGSADGMTLRFFYDDGPG